MEIWTNGQLIPTVSVLGTMNNGIKNKIYKYSHREGNELDNQLEAMMTSQEYFWPDDQIINQSVCDGQEGPFAKHGKALSSVFVQVPQIACLKMISKYSAYLTRWVILMGRGPPQPWLLDNLGM